LEKEELKKLAGEKAVEQVDENMVVGLGTGSTIEYSLKKLGQLVRDGLKIKGIPTSVHTQRIAKDFKIPLTTLEENPVIDLTIDGADEVDGNLNSNKIIIVIDDSKIVKALGIDFPLPVEVLRFGWTSTKKSLEKFGCNVELRKIMGDEPFITDNSNYILDCDFERIENPSQIEVEINNIPGVVDNGLFVGLVDEVIVGGKQGIMSLCKESVV
jgi:ribose 5-phosphate isomerase A